MLVAAAAAAAAAAVAVAATTAADTAAARTESLPVVILDPATCTYWSCAILAAYKARPIDGQSYDEGLQERYKPQMENWSRTIQRTVSCNLNESETGNPFQFDEFSSTRSTKRAVNAAHIDHVQEDLHREHD